MQLWRIETYVDGERYETVRRDKGWGAETSKREASGERRGEIKLERAGCKVKYPRRHQSAVGTT